MVDISLSGISSGNWQAFSEESILQVGEKPLFNIEQLENHERQIRDWGGDFALKLAPDTDVKILAIWLSHLKMVELSVANFSDGRVFSQARAFRDIGYKGEVRVSGPIVPDQAKFLARVGVDTLIIEDASRLGDFKSALQRYNLFYQSSSDSQSTVIKLRHTRAADKTSERKAS